MKWSSLEAVLWLDKSVLVLQKSNIGLCKTVGANALWPGRLLATGVAECGKWDSPSKLAVKRSKIVVSELSDSTGS